MSTGWTGVPVSAAVSVRQHPLRVTVSPRRCHRADMRLWGCHPSRGDTGGDGDRRLYRCQYWEHRRERAARGDLGWAVGTAARSCRSSVMLLTSYRGNGTQR